MAATTTYAVPCGCRLSEEYGYLCIRNDTGWLLWSTKISEMPAKGVFLSGVLSSLHGRKPVNPRELEDSASE
jgi:hypothetical protein